MFNWNVDNISPWYGNSSIVKVVISNNTTSIGDCAFQNCVNIKSILIPESVKKIGKAAFCRCEKLEDIILPRNISYISDGLFEGCKKLNEISISSNITRIGNFAFSECESLINVEIPNSVTHIGEWAFDKCENLVSVRLSSSVDRIRDYTFSGCSSLENIVIPNSVTLIGAEAFSYCYSLSSISFPSSVNEISRSAFQSCKQLRNVVFLKGILYIGEQSFYNCNKLEEITLPDTILSIGKAAFNGCDNISDVYFDGSEEDWNAIAIKANNQALIDAPIHFNSQISEEFHTVTFESNGGSKVESIKVEHGKRVIIYTEPTKEKYIFAGWYSDEGLSLKYDFSTPVTADIILFAKWDQDADIDKISSIPVPFSFRDGPNEEGTATEDNSVWINWSWKDFKDNAYNYNDRLGIASIVLCDAANSSEQRIKKVYKSLGFENYYSGGSFNSNESFYPAMAFATKEITIDGENYGIIVATIRGTTSGGDIITDVAAMLDGFDNAGALAYERLYNYINNGMPTKYDYDHTILYICGHSLGGAIAGELAQKTSSKIADKTNTYVYTYASPNYHKIEGAWNNVFNILNVDDTVPQIPPFTLNPFQVMGIGRVGTDIGPYYWKNMDNTFDSYYKMLTKGNYHNKTYGEIITETESVTWLDILLPSLAIKKSFSCLIPVGNGREQYAHDTNVYFAFLLSEKNNGISAVSKKTMKIAKVACPVDVEVYDVNGKLHGKVEKGVISYSDLTDIIITTSGDEKYIYMPYGSEYELKLVGTDTGTMTYETIEEDMSNVSVKTCAPV